MRLFGTGSHQRTQDEVNALVRLALETAWQLVGERQCVFPYGIIIGKNGQPALFSHDYVGSPPSEEILHLLRAALRRSAAEHRACALVSSTTAEIETVELPAISVVVDHPSSEPYEYIVPYQIAHGKIDIPHEARILPAQRITSR